MLVLGFEVGERAYVSLANLTVEQFLKLRDKPIEITLERANDNAGRLGFHADKSIEVFREPVWRDRCQKEAERKAKVQGLTVSQASNIVWCSYCQRNHVKPVSIEHAAELCCVNKEWLRDLPAGSPSSGSKAVAATGGQP